MTCRDVHSRLPEFIRRTEAGGDVALIEEHLRGCPSCREEEASMRELFSVLGKEKAWTPPAAYWNSLLPRIHARIDARQERPMPLWLSRVAVPLAAALLVAIVAIRSLPGSGVPTAGSLDEAIRSTSGDELQSFAEQQIGSVIADPVQYPADNSVFADDGAVLKDILSDESQTVEAASTDQESTLYAMTDQEAEEVVARLERSLTGGRN